MVQRGVRLILWAWLAVGVTAAVAAASVPMGTAQAAANTGVWVLGALLTGVGFLRRRPRVATPWRLFLGGLVLSGAASAAWWATGGGAAYPALANALQLMANLAFACAAIGFFAWQPTRRSLSARIDVVAAIVFLTLLNAVLTSTEVGSGLAGDPGQVMSLLLGELLLAGAIFSVLEARRSGNRSAWCMAAALSLGILGNGLVVVTGLPAEPFRWAELLWLSGVALATTGALHPDMREFPAEPADARQARNFRRIVPLGVAFIGPVVVLFLGLLLGAPQPALVGGLCVVAFVVFIRVVRMLLEREEALAALTQNERMLQSLLSSTADAVVVVDPRGHCTWMGGNTAILGPRRGGRPSPSDLVLAEDRPQLTEAVDRVQRGVSMVERVDARAVTGRQGFYEIHVVRHHSMSVSGGVVLWWRDVTEQRRKLDDAARDPLTGLQNRSAFEAALREALTDPGRMVAVMFIDLDGFKTVNDTYGHKVGDAVLESAARRLEAQVRAGDLVARFGGDEFAVVCRDLRRPGAAAELGDRIHRSMREPVGVGDRVHTVGCSVGVALRWAEDDDEGEAQLARADAAMYRAKRTGVGVVVAHPTPDHFRAAAAAGRTGRPHP